MSKGRDIYRLNLLGNLHYGLGGFVVLLACILSAFLIAAVGSRLHPLPPCMGGRPSMLAVTMTLFFTLLGWGLAICLFMSGRKMRQRKGRTFSIIVAGIECVISLCVFGDAISPFHRIISTLLQIYSTPFFALGAFSLITLNEKSIKGLYEQKSAESAKSADDIETRLLRDTSQ